MPYVEIGHRGQQAASDRGAHQLLGDRTEKLFLGQGGGGEYGCRDDAEQDCDRDIGAEWQVERKLTKDGGLQRDESRVAVRPVFHPVPANCQDGEDVDVERNESEDSCAACQEVDTQLAA